MGDKMINNKVDWDSVTALAQKVQGPGFNASAIKKKKKKEGSDGGRKRERKGEVRLGSTLVQN